MLISIPKISVSLVMNYSIQLAKIARHPPKRFVLKLRPPPPPPPLKKILFSNLKLVLIHCSYSLYNL